MRVLCISAFFQQTMEVSSRHLKQFLFSQYLADGIRTTVQVVIPAAVFAQFGHLEEGITISLGALCISIADAPGPLKHKRNGMLYANLFVFLLAVLTGLVNNNTVLLGILIGVASFFFSMFSVYGNRAASIGTASLLVMILRMSHLSTVANSLTDSLLILGGGAGYMAVALLLYRLTPYRPAQRSLGECIHETAKYLRIKSALYDLHADPDEEYKKMVTQQVVINDKQEEVRELLFKNRALLKESVQSGRILVLTFVDLVDLYEQMVASWYNYDALREKFAGTGILAQISRFATLVADELDEIGLAIQSNLPFKKRRALDEELQLLAAAVHSVTASDPDAIILQKILGNLQNIAWRTSDLQNYFDAPVSARKMRTPHDYSRFVSHQQINGSLFKNNITLQSAVFRHSLRMMFTCIAGYVISRFLPNGHHSYWLLLTIIVILKPGFSLTKQRNFERFAGTIAGGVAGVCILAFIHDSHILFVLILFFMVGTYTFQRLNYIVMVIFLTPYIMILFNFLGTGFVHVAQERLLDTAIGSVLSFLASYLLFPHWESDQLLVYMAGVLKANISYLNRVADILLRKGNSSLEYKLVRKDVFVSNANLSGSFNRMLSEPKSKQRNGNEIYEFVVLNNVLSSNIASLASAVGDKERSPATEPALAYIRMSQAHLEDSLSILNSAHGGKLRNAPPLPPDVIERAPNHPLSEQLHFLYKLTEKICKVTTTIKNDLPLSARL